jgi:hypothetical protein
MTINISVVFSAVRKILSFEMTIAEWIGTAILLAIPYLVVGVLLGSIVSWPVLLFSDVCMT